MTKLVSSKNKVSLQLKMKGYTGFLGVLMWGEAYRLQSVTGYLRLALFSCEIAHLSKGSISIFQEIFARINKILILVGGIRTME